MSKLLYAWSERETCQTSFPESSMAQAEECEKTLEQELCSQEKRLITSLIH